MYTINILMDLSILIMKVIIIKNNINNINFVNFIIVGPRNQNWYPKLNIPCF